MHKSEALLNFSGESTDEESLDCSMSYVVRGVHHKSDIIIEKAWNLYEVVI